LRDSHPIPPYFLGKEGQREEATAGRRRNGRGGKERKGRRGDGPPPDFELIMGLHPAVSELWILSVDYLNFKTIWGMGISKLKQCERIKSNRD